MLAWLMLSLFLKFAKKSEIHGKYISEKQSEIVESFNTDLKPTNREQVSVTVFMRCHACFF